MAALQEHRLVFNVSVKEVEAIMEGKPAALSLGDCLYAWVMHTVSLTAVMEPPMFGVMEP
jgi:hypothetical protein